MWKNIGTINMIVKKIAFFATYLFVVLHRSPKLLFNNLGEMEIVNGRLLSRCTLAHNFLI